MDAASANPPSPLPCWPRLGAGLSYQGALRTFVRDHLDAFDFLEIIPDIFWTDEEGASEGARFRENAEAVRFLDTVAECRPLVAHSVGLSIGSAERLDRLYIEQLARWQARYHFPWMSEHLAFTRLPGAAQKDLDLGVMLPLPFDEDTLALLSERVAALRTAVPVPFLLENNVSYIAFAEQDLDEPTFLNRLARESGCGLLLDLHNLYTNARNHGHDPRRFLADLDLTRVVEIHIGGGLEWEGVYLDAHSGPCPEEVWTLLDEVLPATPHLGGVVFEMFGNYFREVGPQVLAAELGRLRAVLDRRG